MPETINIADTIYINRESYFDDGLPSTATNYKRSDNYTPVTSGTYKIKLLVDTATASTTGRLRIVGYDENKENPNVIANKVLVPADTANTILSYTFTVNTEKYIRFSFRTFATLLEIEKL